MAQNNFSRAERQAYNSGKGYAIAYMKRGIVFSKPLLRKSFAKGFAKGKEMYSQNPGKYPMLNKKKSGSKKRTQKFENIGFTMTLK